MSSPHVVVLASGRGERFLTSGGSTHKLQALLGDKTVLQHTLDAVRASGLFFHVEDAGHPGMGDSIAAAVRATPDANGWLILPADLPLVRPDTLRHLADASMTQPVLRPVVNGQYGHPVRFARICAQALRALSGEKGAASILRQFGATEMAVNDVGCITDIDTVQDLAAAAQILRSRLTGG